MSKDAVSRHREQQKLLVKEQGEPDSGGEGAEEISIVENLRPTTELFELRLLILLVFLLFFAFVIFHGDKPFRGGNFTSLS